VPVYPFILEKIANTKRTTGPLIHLHVIRQLPSLASQIYPINCATGQFNERRDFWIVGEKLARVTVLDVSPRLYRLSYHKQGQRSRQRERDSMVIERYALSVLICRLQNGLLLVPSTSTIDILLNPAHIQNPEAAAYTSTRPKSTCAR
jgi:hypothetical protein